MAHEDTNTNLGVGVGVGGEGIIKKARRAKTAAIKLANATADEKNEALLGIADSIEKNRDRILAANKKDLEVATGLTEAGKMSKALLDRLKLDDAKIDEIVRSVRDVARLEDPVGKTLSAIELDEGLELFQVSCPIGVIGAVFESRPDVLVQISSLCLKTGNAVLLKGGSEARNSNEALFEVVREASVSNGNGSEGVGGVPDGWVQLLETREEVGEMLKLSDYIDLLVPRGSEEFVKFIQNNTNIMVLGHSEGVCSVFVDRDADLKMAEEVCYDSKVQYPAVCNAAETLLVDSAVASEFLPRMVERFLEAGVEVRGCSRTLGFFDGEGDGEGDGKGDGKEKGKEKLKPASEEDWRTEYNDLIISVRVVDGVDEAVAHINRYGSGHTDAIVTENKETALKFLRFVDSSSVMQNASTRFSDGFRYGKGAEVGISTNKVHARGPVGLEGLVIYKYLLLGKGHAVAPYTGSNAKPFSHKPLSKSF
ncbi:MAG: glutamate-5-semialdehyde dehydrogenase [Methanophagales archaeon]|nr:glutamate-5-semialdehyde dehydrogenase [Methanophagales archaeon]